MRERRFFVPDLLGGREIEIHDQEAHHLYHVLRLGPGDEIVVFDGKGRHFRAVITSANRHFAAVQQLEELPTSESSLELTLAVAVPKRGRMSSIIRMLTELGVARITPLVTERTLSASTAALQEKCERWSRIALEACKQSGRSWIPVIDSPMSFCELSRIVLPENRILVSPRGAQALPIRPVSPCVVAIGPEGGWSEEEVSLASANGFQELSLGPRTLRTETAAVTVASILQWEFGDLKGGRKKEGESRK